MKLLNIVAVAGALAVAAGKQVSGVFTSFDSLKYQKGANYPNITPATPSWVATLSWSLDAAKVAPGDTFTLTLPCVFKFTTDSNTINLQADGATYATCTLTGGEILVPYSSMQCTVTNQISNVNLADGTVYFPLTFSVGGSANLADLQNANCFTAGTNTVTFKDGDKALSTTVDFNGGSSNNQGIDSLNYNLKVLPSINTYQHYALAGNCPDGYSSGTLGISGVNAVIDCSSVHAGITNDINAWYYPKSSSSDFQFQASCSSNQYTITYSNIPAGYRPFIDFLSTNPGVSLRTVYTDTFTCKNGRRTNDGLTRTWGSYNNGGTGSNGNVVKIVTLTWTGTTTGITTLPFSTGPGNTQTVVVEVPVPTTTVTSTWTGLCSSRSNRYCHR
ncbi:bacterial adhesin [Suhomyces tanzawaensis NRRL Y-17324]|uniref:Bacterial adhesin n=1 Tax=Suhomyces tanzawaensis NRRL Y-17324 TaxID=984487 RepID=A0A1E4SJ45_9ASCO|nr:bacterial adhesin [Suhomyces tanzawaensis NRRL Y-17324]ODV79533.1 bacterial adhesin [Suhomyces tanzawaensis NRRL Y-17324]